MKKRTLIESLRSKSEGDKLANRLDDIKSRAIPLLNKIGETFPEYTLHDISHSENILDNFDLLIPSNLEERLNIYELYFLIASTYLHDIGMVNFPGLSDPEDKEEDLPESIRTKHHLRSEEYITKNYKDLMIDDPHQAEIIGKICKGHRKENLSNSDIFDPNFIYKNYSINIALLSSLLRIADELDLTFDRAPLIVYEHAPPRNAISNDEWLKHLEISGVAIHPEDPLKLKCSGRCKNSNIHRALRNLEIKINNELDNLFEHLHQYRDCRKEIPRKFLMDIKAIDYKYHDFRFSLQEKEIMELLMGDKLYNNKEESLREMLKNSVDACRFRRDELKKHGLNYEPRITFYSKQEENEIIVEDNGIGMDEYIIESHFTKIGHSFYRSDRFLKNNHNFEPVGELGIGVLSYFMIADKILIETTENENNNSLIIEIDNISDYFFVKEGDRKISGTVVTLHLNRDFKYKNLIEIIKKYATHIEFPVEVVESDGTKYTIEDEIQFPLVSRHKYYEILKLPLDNEYFSGYIGVLTRKSIGNPFEIAQNDSSLGKNSERNYVSLEGIFVSNNNTTQAIKPIWLRSILVNFDINLKKDVIDLNVARNDIINNEKLIKCKNIFEEKLINIKVKSDSTNADYRYINYSFFKNYVLNRFNMKYASKEKLEISEIFIEFVRQYCYYKCFTNEGKSYLNYDEIVGKNMPITLLRDFNDEDEEYLLEIIENAHKEDIIIIGDEKDSAVIFLSETLFNKTADDFVDLFNWSQILSGTRLDSIFSELHNRLGIAYFLCRTSSYWSTRFVEYANEEEILCNTGNKFIILIKNNANLISDEATIFSLKDFFYDLTQNNDYNHILNKQKIILKLFVEKGIISEHDADKYILMPSDFPPYFFTMSFATYL